MKKIGLVLLLGFLVVADYYLFPILQGMGVASRVQMILFDVVLYSICGFGGLWLASRVKLPIFHRQEKVRVNYLVVGLIICGVLLNTYSYTTVSVERLQEVSFFKNMTPLGAVLLSVRAAIAEELLYRFFLFSLLVWVLGKLMGDGGKTIFLSGVLTAVAFTVQHPGFLWSFFFGGLLAYVYYKKGLSYVLVAHFLIDAIPFVYVAFRLQG